ncbi:MAG: hypothetical protein JO023_24295, partial [Chloroflexi bacterium]|nr:hypothetical protein [Chloroflexota bacterium]
MRWSAASSVALITGLSLAAPAFADLPGIAPYEIEAKEQYCASGGTACTPGGGPIKLADLRFAYVDVLRITPPTGPLANLDNRSLAEPQALAAKCAGPHSVDANGTIHTTVMFVFAGPTNIGYDGGTVHGSVVLQDGGASSTHARAVVAANGSDPVSGDTASVVG